MLSLTRLIDEIGIVDKTLLRVRGTVNTFPPGCASDVAVARSLTLIQGEARCLIHPTIRDVVIAPGRPRVDGQKCLSVGQETSEATNDSAQCCVALDIPGSFWQRDT